VQLPDLRVCLVGQLGMDEDVFHEAWFVVPIDAVLAVDIADDVAVCVPSGNPDASPTSERGGIRRGPSTDTGAAEHPCRPYGGLVAQPETLRFSHRMRYRPSAESSKRSSSQP